MTKTEEAAVQAGFVALAVATGAQTPTQGARALLGLAIDMVPVEDLRDFLAERDRIWADLAADVAERIKMGR